MTAPTGEGPARSGSIFLRKTGPLANWMWMAILLLVALVYAMWKRNRAEADVPTDEGPEVDHLGPGDQTAPPVFILPQNPQPTVPININLPPTPPAAPPAAGRPDPPKTPPVVAKPVPKPAPPPAYTAVKVAKYTSKNPPWNSTLWGIAKQYGYGAAGNNYAAILNDPKNAALKKKIGGDPRKLPVGATVYVRKK